MLGYFSLVGLLRLHSLLGDYYQALKVVENIDFDMKVPTPLNLSRNFHKICDTRDFLFVRTCTRVCQPVRLARSITWASLT